MRSVALAGCLVASLVATAAVARADAKEPVWLGIAYDLHGAVGLTVTHVYDGSAAALAGLAVGDEIVEVGPMRTPPADLHALITAMQVGQHVKLTVVRDGKLLALEAVLLPRADGEIVQRRLVGKPAPDVHITRADTGAVVDLAALDRKVAILAFFPASCDACASVVSALGPWAAAHDRDPVVVLGATPAGDPAAVKAFLTRNPIVVPVGAMPGLDEAAFDSPFFADPTADAVTFVVIDGKGVVRLASIIAPGGEQQLDDVCVAAERAIKDLKASKRR